MTMSSTQGEVMECEAEGVEIPVVFVPTSAMNQDVVEEIDVDVVEESSPVEQATSQNTKERGRSVMMGKSLRSLKERIKMNRQSEQASNHPTRLNHAKTRFSLLVASSSVKLIGSKRRKPSVTPSVTTKNTADDPPDEDTAVKDSQKGIATNVILTSLSAETPRGVKKRKSKRFEDKILADDLSEDLSTIDEDRSIKRKKTAKSRLSSMLTGISSRNFHGTKNETPLDEKRSDDKSIDTASLTDDRSVASKLSNLVAEREGEAEQEINELVDVVLREFSDQEIQTGLKEQMRSVSFAKRAQVYLRTRAEDTLEAIVDEIDSNEFQQAIKSPDAWNDLVGCGAMTHPEILVDTCGTVASIIGFQDDSDITKNYQDDDDTLQISTDGDSMSDLQHLDFDDDNSFMSDSLDGSPLEDDTLEGALRVHDFAKAMTCLKKRAARTGMSEVTLLDAVRAKQQATSRARQACPPRPSRRE